MTLILGIESSCDETAAAVVDRGRVIWSNVIATQHELHERYRGVVPELASRAHVEKIEAVIAKALEDAEIGYDDLSAIAVGNRPGLIGSLMVGVSAAKAIAWAIGKPLIGVDHVRSHLYAGALTDGKIPLSAVEAEEPITYPGIGLVVSGGHTSVYDMSSATVATLIGRTIDDAIGEAYDKAAVILGLPYPGGPNLDKLAKTGDPSRFKLPQSMLGKESLDFSYSGLKTALLYKVRGFPKGRGAAAVYERSIEDLEASEIADLAASFQDAATGVVIKKLKRVYKHMKNNGRKPKTLVVGGGVSANSLLRTRLVEFGHNMDVEVFIPSMNVCLDNAAMIAGLGYRYYLDRRFDDLSLPAVATTKI